MESMLTNRGWSPLPSRKDYCKGQYMISLFRDSWQLTYSPEQKILKEGTGFLSRYELQQLELEIFGKYD